MAAELTRLRDAQGVGELVEFLAEQLSTQLGASTGAARDVALVGVRRGGVALSGRLAERLKNRGFRVDVGTVDIALYRDDAHLGLPRPATGPTDILFAIDGRQVVIVDDVFWTGRTARAAIDAVLDFGRPRRLWFAALVERKGRELPIVPDVAALSIFPPPDEKVEVRLVEDGHAADELVLLRKGAR